MARCCRVCKLSLKGGRPSRNANNPTSLNFATAYSCSSLPPLLPEASTHFIKKTGEKCSIHGKNLTSSKLYSVSSVLRELHVSGFESSSLAVFEQLRCSSLLRQSSGGRQMIGGDIVFFVLVDVEAPFTARNSRCFDRCCWSDCFVCTFLEIKLQNP